ncbi:MAG: alginate export family protein [Myxococcota bacterium]
MKQFATILIGLVVGLFLLSATAQTQETTSPKRPGPQLLRAEEDWGLWGERQDPQPQLPFDGLKYIAFGEDVYLTLGGQFRLAHELFINERYGEVDQDDSGSLLLRMMPHINLRIGPNFRVFTEFKSTHESGRDEGPTPVDVDRLDVHQLFTEVSIADPRQTHNPNLLLRLGRQELFYGEGRLVDVRDGPPVRRTFDVGLLRFDAPAVRIDALFALEVPVQPGVFDNGSEEEGTTRPRLWGSYAKTQPFPLGGGFGLGFDLYYLGVDQDRLVFVEGSGQERRHSAGGRWWLESRTFRHELEGTVQWGELEDPETGRSSTINAWGVAASASYTFADHQTRPSVKLSGGAQSGDTTPGDGKLGTYRAPFPNLRWAGATTGVGPGNGFGGNLSVGFHPLTQLHLLAIARVFFRLSLDDAPYSPAGFPLRVAPESDKRHVGSSVALNVNWLVHTHITAYVRGEIFEPGGYLEDAPPAQTTGFLTVGSDVKF